MNKRTFLKSLALSGVAISSAGKLLASIPSDHDLASSPDWDSSDFWEMVRNAYAPDSERINLENGYYCTMPKPTLEASIRHQKELNLLGSYYLRTKQADDRVAIRGQLANFAGCSIEEIIVTRNTTESLDTVISGLDWRPGDEAVMASQDYPSMLEMFKQESRRHGVINRVISVPNHPSSDDEIVSLYEKAITSKTRLLMVCHMINITGQILPVRKICDMAHGRGVPVMVDGSHSFAQIDFKIPQLSCDYYGASLHKWLGAPLGTGILYVRKDRIPGLWPLLGDNGYASDDIRKLNHIGTNPVHSELTIPDAIAFHNKIGAARKESRLRFLQQYWTAQIRDVKGITVNTPAQSHRACAIANVGIDRMSPADLANQLLDRFNIWTVAIDNPDANVRGVRITPQLYTTKAELDSLLAALLKLCHQ